MQQLKPIMFVGTASDVGKSFINTGFCRIFKQDGYQPAPFKAQNMSLNSFVTPDGLEIGRAQAVQAEACGLPCSADMNPVLLKPTNDKTSQVVLMGKPVGSQSAYDYFMGNNKQELLNAAKAAFDRLQAQYNPVVMEGAGSISELNLKHRDITNMRMALHAKADVYLVADIDKGGIFGSVYGTIALLPPEEKALLKGIIVNKFRGDARLFETGKTLLEELCGVPVVGIIPFRKDIYVEEEDSVALAHKQQQAGSGKVNVVVVLLNRLSNFTDFTVLEKDERVHLYYSNNPAEIAQADIVILPGSKNTIADLVDIKNNGVATAITQAFKGGRTVIGICGGYQMMGQSVEDPAGVEGTVSFMPGLGLLPVTTVLTEVKTTQQCTFQYKNSAATCEGYEIHMGITASSTPLNTMLHGHGDGYLLNDRCWGTYVHGILDNPVVVDDLLSPFSLEASAPFDYNNYKHEQYDKLAQHLREHVDIAYIYSQLKSEQ
ncbi:cobyric acid synthase [Chitinophaga sancti]|uniref:cobyric acid synthase n=1 Tax=Chitinophaga sancti TaxID=1004 RepID=UPI002A7549E9|nr:cobyric acid synthase [Chitinophaga sancti]WPQ61053.1 cobyric acid synthase [Chitinophaga sancti]